MKKTSHYAGDKYNSLSLVSSSDGTQNYTCCDNKTIFLCGCGNTHTATLNNVIRGIVKMCRHCSSIRKSSLKKTHGYSDARKKLDPLGYKAYYTWQAMKRRCYYEKDKRFKDYGGRGIKICDRWVTSFENFLEDMGKPSDFDMSIDRINTDGNYEPSNCRWVTMHDQASNKRTNRNINAFGKTQTLNAWAEETGIKRETIAYRLNAGWEAEKALTKKLRYNFTS